VRSQRIGLTSTEGKIALEADAANGSVISVSSVRGDVKVTIRRHGALRIDASGSTVALPKGSEIQTDANGVRHLLLGTDPTAETAVLTIQSRYGAVKLVAIQ
jgi:surface antigen